MVALLLAGMLWWFWPEQTPKTKVQSPNLVTQSTTPPTETKPKRPVQRAQQGQTSDDVAPVTTPAVRQSTTTGWTYKKVYQKFRLARRCDEWYRLNHNKPELDLLDFYVRAYKRMNRLGEDRPEGVQIERFERLLSDCMTLQVEVQKQPDFEPLAENGNYQNLTRDYLSDLLLKFPAETAAEKHLKQSWLVRQQWLDLIRDVLQVSKGYDSMDESELGALREQLRALRTEKWSRKEALAEAFTEAMSKEYDQMIYALEDQIENQRRVDLELKKELIARLSEKTEVLQKRLANSPVESYELVTESLNLSQGYTFKLKGGNEYYRGNWITSIIPELTLLNDQLRPLSAVKHPEHFELLFPIANQWFMCQRQLSCGPNSEWMTEHCLGNGDRIANPRACGLGVEAFFQDVYLSPNQALDVVNLMGLLESLYDS